MAGWLAWVVVVLGLSVAWAEDEVHPWEDKFDLEDIFSRYYTNAELAEFMDEFTTTSMCSKISRKFSIGKSVNGEDLWVLEISNNPGKEEPKPNFKYIANMHGDETGGRQLLIGLARWLCDNYPSNVYAAKIVRGMHLFLMPTMNPDGYAIGPQRYNANGKDLNRNFPDRIRDGLPLVVSSFSEPETKAVAAWVLNGSFVASANMHEGALVANYPWDADAEGKAGYSASPDDATFRHIAWVYSRSHASMYLSQEFENGITNGNDWYPVYGGMQDFNYVAAKCMELTLELSDEKNPPASTLTKMWEDNRQAMLNYAIGTSFGGISGYVLSATNLEPLVAEITVSGINHTVYSKPTFGDYYRPIVHGSYVITATAPGYLPQSLRVIVPKDFGVGAVANFQLNEMSGKKGMTEKRGKPQTAGCGELCEDLSQGNGL